MPAGSAGAGRGGGHGRPLMWPSMLRLACHTDAMVDDDLDARLSAAAERLDELREPLEGGGAWPLAERFDHNPEAEWGPREVLAHLSEMLPFWLGETERVLDPAGSPATFGRVATDEIRLALLGRDRTLPMRELIARVHNGITRWRDRWATLGAADRARTGRHVTLGELTVAEIASRFAVGHLEEHLEQLAQAMHAEPASG